MNNYYVYQHITLDTNEIFYVGISKTPNFKRAFDFYDRSKWWKKIIKKHGHKVEILFENLTKEQACAKETELILLHGRRDLGTGSLVNMTPGGEGTKEWTIEQRQAQRNRKLGKIHTAESKANMKKSSRAAKKVIDLDTGQIFDSVIDVSKFLNKPSGTIAKWLNGQRKNPTNLVFLENNFRKEKFSKDIRKPILQFDLNNNFIQEFDSILDAQRFLGLKSSHIAECVKGKLKTSNGYIWKLK